MSGITTHVLDTSRGRPAAGVMVRLARLTGYMGEVEDVGHGLTDADGRLRGLVPDGFELRPGTYRLTFQTGAYFGEREVATFYPHVSIDFEVTDAAQHYHVPLLVSPFGYSTYRGS